MKKVECCECGREVEVPDDIDPDEIAVFCSKRCEEQEAYLAYLQERNKEREEEEDC